MKKSLILPRIVAVIFAALVLPGFVYAKEKVLASGSWTKKANSISGTWKIVEDGGSKKLKLTGFKTKKAPDLKIFFSEKPLSALTSKNARASSKFLAKLKSTSGDQEYVIPEKVDLSKLKTVLIHCEKFSKLWGGSALR